MATQLESLRLMWLEDPCPPHDLNALRYLRSHTRTPIGTGENLQLREGFQRLIYEDLCDVVTPDLQKAGILKTLLILPLMNLICYGAVLAFVAGGAARFLSFWADGARGAWRFAGEVWRAAGNF